MPGKCSCHWCHTDVRNHFDGQRRSQDKPGILTCQLKRQQTQCHGGQTGADQRDHLRCQQMAISAVGQNGEHVVFFGNERQCKCKNPIAHLTDSG